jgi:hypothetical protein
LWLQKKYENKFFSPLSFVPVLGSGSGMDKHQDPGSEINIPDPQHCYLVNTSVADPDPGSKALTPGSGMGKNSDPGSLGHISESLVSIYWVKNT